MLGAPAPDDWVCAECSFTNVGQLGKCDLCERVRPSLPALPAPKTIPGPPPAPLRQPLGELSQNERQGASLAPSSARAPDIGAVSSHHRPSKLDVPSISAAGSSTAPPPTSASPPPPAPVAPSASSQDTADAEDEQHPWSKELADANRCVFGGSALRPLQRRVVHAALGGRDVLVVMPTGAGKSRCFQLPAVVSSGVTVVITPLLSLIHDQVEGLSRHSVRALQLTSRRAGPTVEPAARKSGSGASTCHPAFPPPLPPHLRPSTLS